MSTRQRRSDEGRARSLMRNNKRDSGGRLGGWGGHRLHIKERHNERERVGKAEKCGKQRDDTDRRREKHKREWESDVRAECK